MLDSFFYANKASALKRASANANSALEPPLFRGGLSIEFVKPRSLRSLGPRNLRKKSTVVASDSLLDFLLDFKHANSALEPALCRGGLSLEFVKPRVLHL